MKRDDSLVLTFENGWRVSIIRNDLSYGLELATMRFSDEENEWVFKQFPGVTDEDGILGYLTSENLVELINDVKNGI